MSMIESRTEKGWLLRKVSTKLWFTGKNQTSDKKIIRKDVRGKILSSQNRMTIGTNLIAENLVWEQLKNSKSKNNLSNNIFNAKFFSFKAVKKDATTY